MSESSTCEMQHCVMTHGTRKQRMQVIFHFIVSNSWGLSFRDVVNGPLVSVIGPHCQDATSVRLANSSTFKSSLPQVTKTQLA